MRTFTIFCFQFFICFSLYAAHGGSIKGVVIASNDNDLLVGVSVRLQENGLTTTTNEIGYFHFPDLENGTYTIVASYLGYETSSQRINVNNHETSSIRLFMVEKALALADVEINAQKRDALQSISQLDVQLRPIQSAQDILRSVPGLFIAQHAGGGKAEQIFLRGFDIDHGTDIALFADGVPVNMVSHAHGQGYADLHFIIPELVQNVDFQKGTYDARVGNFATAGQVMFETPNVLSDNMFKLEAGQFDTYRMMTAVNLLGSNAASKGNSAYIASEQLFSNAYFDAPQSLRRSNYFAKLTQVLDQKQSLNVSLSHFSSSWLASGQIPERAVQSGQISHFGAIDATEGGATKRSNINLIHYYTLSDKTLIKNQFYASKYQFELYSNFTFFLNDPEYGDQIRQKEDRLITGYQGSIAYQNRFAGRPYSIESGVQLRSDAINGNELSHTRNRRTLLSNIALGDIQETNAALYTDMRVELTPTLSLHTGIRADQFQYNYVNALDSSVYQNLHTTRGQVSPKFNLQWQATPKIQFYFRTGRGFHSNDTRVVLYSTDQNILPSAWGQDIGLIYKPLRSILLQVTGWNLASEQEFVYVGDEGIVEPGGKGVRRGIDLSVRWQPAPWLFFDGDYTFSHARFVDEPEGGQRVPLAPVHTGVGGVTVQKAGIKGSVRMRWLGDRPANEDNSLTAAGYCLMDAQLSLFPKFSSNKRPLEVSFSVQNIFNTYWKEAQFATESRLRDEPASVTEIHYTPGTPFAFKGGVCFRF
jgi:hypothetical protein